MKISICLIAMMIGTLVFADNSQPKYLKDATITVTLKNGKQYTFSENDYKVVLRLEEKKDAVMIASSVQESINNKETAVVANNNEVSLYGGYGATGLNVSTVGNSTTVDQKNGVVFGLGYSHRIKGPVNVKVIMFNNNSYFGGLGLEF